MAFQQVDDLNQALSLSILLLELEAEENRESAFIWATECLEAARLLSDHKARLSRLAQRQQNGNGRIKTTT